MGKILQDYYCILLLFLISLWASPSEVYSQSVCNDKTLIGWYSSGSCTGYSACAAESYISGSALSNCGYYSMDLDAYNGLNVFWLGGWFPGANLDLAISNGQCVSSTITVASNSPILYLTSSNIAYTYFGGGGEPNPLNYAIMVDGTIVTTGSNPKPSS